ncbi:MAG: hypothetical protein ACRD26_22070 [Vicinamibacterales bacterium]
MTGRIVILCIALAGGAPIAAAQTVILTPADPKRWDTSVTIGWLGGNKDAIAERWNNWYDTFATSVDVGRYWTPHLKTGVGATVTTEGTVYSQERLDLPGRPGPIFFTREHRFQFRSLNLSAAYQFLDNTWVHPFLAAGVQIASERGRFATFPTEPFATSPPPPSRSRLDVHPFVSAGAKFYVTERGFLRTDLSAAIGARGATNVAWRAGGGVDF